MVAPMPPARSAPGAIPRVLDAQIEGLLERHDLTLAFIAGPEPWELDAAHDLVKRGLDVRAVRRSEPAGRDRWRRRWHLSSTWLRSGWPWRTVWFWEAEMQRLLSELLAEDQFDVVAVEDNAMAVYELAGSAPAVLTEHEVRRPRGLAAPPWRPDEWASWAVSETDWRRWHRYLARVWEPFDALQVFGERDAGLMGQMAPAVAERVRVNPFGVALPELPSLEAVAVERSNTIVFAGNYTHEPNVDAASWLVGEIMPLLRRAHPGTHLQLIGNHAPSSVRALAASDVELLGYVPEVDETLRRASVVVAPIRIGGGMRMKVLHSMALGQAVVTTCRGVDGLQIAGETTPVIVADTAEAFAAETARLLKEPAEREQLGAAARAFVERHHSPRAYAERLERTYASIANRPAARTIRDESRARPSEAARQLVPGE